MFRREFCLSQLLKCSQAASREYKQYCEQSTKRLASKSPLTPKAFLDVWLMFFAFAVAVNQSIQVKTSLVPLWVDFRVLLRIPLFYLSLGFNTRWVDFGMGYTCVSMLLWFGLFASRPWLICVIPDHCGRCTERLISPLEEANIWKRHTTNRNPHTTQYLLRHTYYTN